MSFYYKKGVLETSIPWIKPTNKLFDLWLSDFLKLTSAIKYDIWLCGGFLQRKWDAWDIDIVMNGPLDISALEYILINGHYIGIYKYNLLLDIQYHFDDLTWPFDKTRQVKKIIMYDTIIKNSEVVTDLRRDNTLKKISRTLWQITRIEPSEKQIRRIQDYKKPPKLLHRHID